MSEIGILIVDESLAVHKFVKQLLESYGFESDRIKSATDPVQATEVGAALKPDFLLTQWFDDKPIDGIALHEYLVTLNPECQFALTSSDASPERQALARAAGAAFLLPRPFTADALRAQFRSTLAAHLAPPEVSQSQRSSPARSATAVLPEIAKLKTGDRVRHGGEIATVKYVILRRGELLVQLQGIAGMVPARLLPKV